MPSDGQAPTKVVNTPTSFTDQRAQIYELRDAFANLTLHHHIFRMWLEIAQWANARLALVGSSPGKGERHKIPGNAVGLPFQVSSKSSYIPQRGATQAT